jgi:hypothetical protein
MYLHKLRPLFLPDTVLLRLAEDVRVLSLTPVYIQSVTFAGNTFPFAETSEISVLATVSCVWTAVVVCKRMLLYCSHGPTALSLLFTNILVYIPGHAVAQLIEALRYKP